MSSREVAPAMIDDEPERYEHKHVHAIYDEIAVHFSSTRYKPWPIISDFLSSLSPGWIGLDSGTGNGKYLPLPLERPGDILTIGMDRSTNLLQIARDAGHSGTVREVIMGDVLGRGWRTGIFDYAISIATIHHLSTHDRRKLAVKRLIEAVSPKHGRVLIYVWAVEQDEMSKRIIPIEGGTNKQNGQDVMVPWVLPKQMPPVTKGGREEPEGSQVFNRYYHMFSRGELEGLVREAATDLGLCVESHLLSREGTAAAGVISIVRGGWERSNYFVELKRWMS